MAKYVSRSYLHQKWEKVKWDMEKVLDVNYQAHTEDRVSAEDVSRCYDLIDNLQALLSEIVG